jgi:2'-5' RNA ligase
MLRPQVDNDTYARLFLAAPVPPTVRELLKGATKEYSNFVEKVVPEEKWHVTLLWLGGEVLNHSQYVSRLSKPLSQAYAPAITLTHVGRGLQRGQLWAYAHVTPMLTQLREALQHRLHSMRFPLPSQRDYVPHIHVADLFDMSRGFGLADQATPITFPVREIYLYKSVLTPQGSQYQIESTISLT